MIYTADIRRPLALAALLLAMVCALVSCSENGDEPVAEAQRYYAGFYLTVGDVGASRATPTDGTYDPGSGYENYIDLTTVRLLLFSNDGTDAYLGEMTEFDIRPLSSGLGSKRYKLEASTTHDISSGKFKIMILANWPNHGVRIRDKEAVFSHEYQYKSSTLSASNLIPLYGIKAVNIDGGIRENESVNLGDIHLLRAMAKIEVIYEDDPDNVWPMTPTLVGHNDRGFCAPTGVMNEEEYVKHSYDEDYVDYVSIPADATAQMAEMDFIEVTPGKDWVAYVPEYNNQTEAHTYIKINFPDATLADGTVPEGTPNPIAPGRVDFKLGGSYYDIRRNYWYKIRVTRKNDAIESTVDVLPYTVINLDPTHGLGSDYPNPDPLPPEDPWEDPATPTE